MNPSRHEHDQYTAAASDRLLDDLAIVRRSRNDNDALLERVELRDAFFAAHADDLVPSVERLLHHVLAKLP